MKVIIAGSRSISGGTAISAVTAAIHASDFAVSEVVSGGAVGVDQAGEAWARAHAVPVRRFEPDYTSYPGHYAPLMRNQAMADYADALVAVWDGRSRGTADMLERARKRGLRVYEHHAALARAGERLAAVVTDLALDDDGCPDCGYYHDTHRPDCALAAWRAAKEGR